MATTLNDFIQKILDLDYFTGARPVIPAVWDPGEIPLTFVTGPNAGGKSFFRRLVCGMAQRWDIEAIHLSMEGRANAGPLRGMIYGSEEWQATGCITCHTTQMAMKTSAERTTPHVLIWDEPEIGLSEEAVAGVADAMIPFFAELPEQARGIFIISHSRELGRRLQQGLGRLHYLHLGTPRSRAPATLSAWLDRDVVPISPDQILEQGHKRFKRIQAVLNGKSRK